MNIIYKCLCLPLVLFLFATQANGLESFALLGSGPVPPPTALTATNSATPEPTLEPSTKPAPEVTPEPVKDLTTTVSQGSDSELSDKVLIIEAKLDALSAKVDLLDNDVSSLKASSNSNESKKSADDSTTTSSPAGTTKTARFASITNEATTPAADTTKQADKTTDVTTAKPSDNNQAKNEESIGFGSSVLAKKSDPIDPSVASTNLDLTTTTTGSDGLASLSSITSDALPA